MQNLIKTIIAAVSLSLLAGCSLQAAMERNRMATELQPEGEAVELLTEIGAGCRILETIAWDMPFEPGRVSDEERRRMIAEFSGNYFRNVAAGHGANAVTIDTAIEKRYLQAGNPAGSFDYVELSGRSLFCNR